MSDKSDGDKAIRYMEEQRRRDDREKQRVARMTLATIAVILVIAVLIAVFIWH